MFGDIRCDSDASQEKNRPHRNKWRTTNKRTKRLLKTIEFEIRFICSNKIAAHRSSSSHLQIEFLFHSFCALSRFEKQLTDWLWLLGYTKSDWNMSKVAAKYDWTFRSQPDDYFRTTTWLAGYSVTINQRDQSNPVSLHTFWSIGKMQRLYLARITYGI